MRDLKQYEHNYQQKSFEDWQVMFRRKKVLSLMNRYPHNRILEIGCGMEPLVLYMPENAFDSYTIVEPSDSFFQHSQEATKGNRAIRCFHMPFAALPEMISAQFDFIICSSLLHELEKPEQMLQEIRKICTPETVVHINVPNANSFHRLLAREMKIITDTHCLTDRNLLFQQHTVFDENTLSELILENGFEIIESGSFFIKPFTHAQMYAMLTQGIMDETVLEGLYQLGERWNAFGSEIFVNIKLLQI